jgi:predicted TIM-barrel fold metal-dependent hydrolase
VEYRIISADSHINEPPGTFVDRVPAHLKDKAPRIMRAADGGDGWSWDGKPPRMSFGLNALAGRPYEDYKDSGITFEEILPGNYDGAAHIKDMALDGVDASVVYPAAALGTYTCADRELGLACVRAYNDWLIDEFCATDPKRLVSLCILPVDDGMEETLTELRRVQKKGAKGLFVPGCPQKPYQDPYYEPLWQAAEEYGLSINVHRNHGGTPPIQDQQDNFVAGVVIRFFSAIRPLSNLVFSGVFERHPKLKVVAAETNFGWMPFWIEMMEDEYTRQRHWAKLPISKSPKEYIWDNVACTFLEDHSGMAYIEHLPPDAPMFSTDYPHSVTLWPNSAKIAGELTKGLAPELKHKVLAGNAASIYNL